MDSNKLDSDCRTLVLYGLCRTYLCQFMVKSLDRKLMQAIIENDPSFINWENHEISFYLRTTF